MLGWLLIEKSFGPSVYSHVNECTWSFLDSICRVSTNRKKPRPVPVVLCEYPTLFMSVRSFLKQLGLNRESTRHGSSELPYKQDLPSIMPRTVDSKVKSGLILFQVILCVRHSLLVLLALPCSRTHDYPHFPNFCRVLSSGPSMYPCTSTFLPLVPNSVIQRGERVYSSNGQLWGRFECPICTPMWYYLFNLEGLTVKSDEELEIKHLKEKTGWCGVWVCRPVVWESPSLTRCYLHWSKTNIASPTGPTASRGRTDWNA